MRFGSMLSAVAGVGVLLLVSSLNGSVGQLPLQSKPEKTGFKETSTYQDVVDFLDQLKKAGAPIRIVDMGNSAEGRMMPLVIAAKPMIFSAAEAKATGKPIIYIQANIHAGEVEGKEAALHLLRSYTLDPKSKVLDKAIFLITPIYNADGNEKFGPQNRNRPGQNGPESVGLRPNGQGFDLNRDCIKVVTPEMQAVLKFVYNAYDPDVVFDLHTTNGTRHGYPLTYSPPLNPNTHPAIMKYVRDELLPSVRKSSVKKYGSDLFDYGNSENRDGKQAWYSFSEQGRYVTNYVGLRNRIAILSEATTYWPFKDRILWTERFVDDCIQYLLRDPKKVTSLSRLADRDVFRWGSDPNRAPAQGVGFEFDSRGEEEVLLEKRMAGGTRPSGQPIDLEKIKMTVFDRFKVTVKAKYPRYYLIRKSEEKLVGLLKLHGVVVSRAKSPTELSGDVFMIEQVNVAQQAFQGVKITTLQGEFKHQAIDLQKDDYLIDMRQPLGSLIFFILEPQCNDGAAAWGYINELKGGTAFPVSKIYEKIDLDLLDDKWVP